MNSLTTDEILPKLTLPQLRDLINLFGLTKPHSRSTKPDLINFIKSSNAVIDPKMLINYFKLTEKPQRKRRDISAENAKKLSTDVEESAVADFLIEDETKN